MNNTFFTIKNIVFIHSAAYSYAAAISIRAIIQLMCESILHYGVPIHQIKALYFFQQLESSGFPKIYAIQRQKIVKPYERTVFFNDYFFI